MYFVCFSVKPAVFDLFLALAIAAYLAIIYVLVQVNKGNVDVIND